MKYKMVAMDLDGTLTQHKSPLEPFNKIVLDKLCARYYCAIIGAGACNRIFRQLNGYNIDIVGNYGMEASTVSQGKLVLVKSEVYSVDRDFFENAVTDLRQRTGYTAYCGDNVEFHPSGAVTFPLLGTAAKLEDKLAFDPQGTKRTAIYELVSTTFADYHCFIGGTSSFDIVKKRYDKFTAISKLAAEKGIKLSEVLYLGDDFKRGGNDEQVLLGGVACIKVTDYTALSDLLIKEGVI